jgi:hypothetical protein
MKQEISWIGLTKLLHAKKKKETGGKVPISLKDILPEAKKVWAAIKAGTDPTYTQGKQAPGKRSSTKKSTKKTNKTGMSKSNTTKKMKEGGSAASTAEVKALLKECHLCKKCAKKVNQALGQKGGEYGTNDVQARENNTFSDVE